MARDMGMYDVRQTIRFRGAPLKAGIGREAQHGKSESDYRDQRPAFKEDSGSLPL